MNREIKKVKTQTGKPERIEAPQTAWDEQSKSGKFTYLLAHAEDGVIWGKVDGGKLLLSSDAYPAVSPKLRVETLRELRLFGKKAEWFLWRSDDGWRARLIEDGAGGEAEYFDEKHILWGTNAVEKSKPPFTLVTEADTGIRHAPPIALNGRHSLRLVVRHYLAESDNGVAFVKLSRLVDLENGGKS